MLNYKAVIIIWHFYCLNKLFIVRPIENKLFPMVVTWVVFPLLGSEIYGRVMVDPVQNLGNSFICNIEKVFLCTGADGYVPKYSPDNKEYGCLADSPSLLYRFKILVCKLFLFFFYFL